MADSDSPELAAALLRWVQAFDTSRKVDHWEDIQDGRVLWEILRDIDPGYFEDDLPEPPTKTEGHWIPRWQNLKHINRLVTAYLRDASGSIENPSGSLAPDLKAIATDASPKDTVMLLKTMLRAAMYSPESNQRMGRIVVGLGPETAVTIAAAMKQMEDADSLQPDTPDHDRHDTSPDPSIPAEQAVLENNSQPPANRDRIFSGASVDRDPELEQEEKLIQAYKVIQDLENTNAKAATELDELRQDKEELQQAFDAFKYEVENQGRTAAEDDTMKEMQTQVERDRDYIAELETELETIREKSQGQERQIERFKADTDSKQKLRDDNQLLSAERDDLLQKTRMNENLKKKIQALQDQEKTNESLQEDLRMANEKLQDLDRIKEQCAILQKANTENMKTIANGEQEIFDQKTTRKRMEHEYKVLTQKWEAARERQSHDHEVITELENKLQTLELGGSNGNGANGGLDGELEATEKARLEKTKARSQDTTIPSADAAVLQERLDAITARNAKLEADYLDILQDKLGLETSLEDLRSPTREPSENVPFLEQRKKLQSTQAELQEMRNQQFTANTEMATIKERFLAMQKQVTDKDIRSLDGDVEYQALTDRYSELHKHSENIEAELAEQRSLLRHALLNSTQLLKEAAETRNDNEYKLLLQQMQSIRDSPDDDELLESTAAQVADRIEHSRLEGASALKRADTLTTELQTLKQQVASGTVSGTGAAPTLEMTALQRENKLITSAWFDLSSRLQSNTVMIGRRKESPKSFLGKQRVLVTPGLVGGQYRR